jgi:hypothetical protein
MLPTALISHLAVFEVTCTEICMFSKALIVARASQHGQTEVIERLKSLKDQREF